MTPRFTQELTIVLQLGHMLDQQLKPLRQNRGSLSYRHLHYLANHPCFHERELASGPDP
ncbi:hypothetical protein ACQEVI_03515 [Promicromonospora sp. CA-289599]|uniref:hypothetical protein n=1 Tax=Promicromonospora sp. CA-289599 TaxID=3240014 RepID=UPI003D8F07A4